MALLFLICKENDEASEKAKTYMKNNHIRYKEIPHDTLGAERYTPPTLIAQGEVYQGFSEIKHGLICHIRYV